MIKNRIIKETGAELLDGIFTSIGSELWFSWLQGQTSFYYKSSFCGYTVTRRSKGKYWYGIKMTNGIKRMVYIGSDEHLTKEKLREVGWELWVSYSTYKALKEERKAKKRQTK